MCLVSLFACFFFFLNFLIITLFSNENAYFQLSKCWHAQVEDVMSHNFFASSRSSVNDLGIDLPPGHLRLKIIK